MKPFALLALALLAAGCAAHRLEPQVPSSYDHLCRNGFDATIRDLRASGLPKDDLTRHLSTGVLSAPGMPSLIDYLYDGDPRTPYEVNQYVQRWCHDVGWQGPTGPPSPAAKPAQPPSLAAQAIAAGIGAALTGATYRAIGSPYTYRSTHTYKTSAGWKTSYTKCTYGRYSSTCKSR